MPDHVSPPKARPPGLPPANQRTEEPPPRPGAMQRLLPWVDLAAKLLTAIAAALAIWNALG
jgi:hypothetical protein